GIILTSDQQLRDIQDPDKKIDMSTGYNHVSKSLREVCEEGKRRGDKTLTIAFDEFFRQYRPQAGTDRKLTPDMDEYVEMIGNVGDFAKKYGMGLCLSLMSPLELGPAFKNYTGESGRWLSYEVGYRNPESGSFSLDIWEQLTWTNNKGKIHLQRKGVKAFAFNQKTLGGSHFIAVNPDDLVEITGITVSEGDIIEGCEGGEYGIKNTPEDMIFPVRRLNIRSDGGQKGLEGKDRVLVLVEYETPEMDYFNPRAQQFLHDLLDKYKKRGVVLNEFYSDEMHIQQDWVYFSHQENGQLNYRYLTPSFSQKYKERFGQALDDKYMLYFAYAAPYFINSTDAVRNVQYVMGDTPEAIHKTFLLRDRYYKMLNGDVVDLFKEGKAYAEKLYGHEFRTGAHSSWAESPTIDHWDVEKLHENAYKYEYTPNYVWGNTVHQASAACYDYFKWGEYLQPTGNDFAECGWGDRNYYGAAMGTSIGVINRFPNAYAAAWGFPQEALAWKNTINEAFGASPGAQMSLLTDRVHRDIEVLLIYPMNLVAVEERFGSWMTQYGYSNYLTSEKLVEMGSVGDDGKLHVAAKEYGTVAVMFEPLPSKGLLNLLQDFASKGGKVIWFSAPPLIDGEGKDCSKQWQSMFGATYDFDVYMGETAAGKLVEFVLDGVGNQLILTDFLVDKIYPVKPAAGVEKVAMVEDQVVGTHRKAGKGDAYYFGFRPRDDQSQSLGYETRTLFEILQAVGSYPSSGKFAVNDNPTVVSRTTEFFATAFPNGATAIVKHYRTHRENWAGGFSRDKAADDKSLAINPMPSDALNLEGLKVNGHEVTYSGKMNVAFNTDADGRLIAFYGKESQSIVVDGVEYTFTEQPVSLAFGPVAGDQSKYRIYVDRPCKLTVPMPQSAKKATIKQGKTTVKGALDGGNLLLDVQPGLAGRWFDVTLK
ncbi:MAG: hypothetical protein IK076_03880, partial [Bacteroidales bacterium]|nr:hypothetical protein [Bacteroidales bacterium]